MTDLDAAREQERYSRTHLLTVLADLADNVKAAQRQLVISGEVTSGGPAIERLGTAAREAILLHQASAAAVRMRAEQARTAAVARWVGETDTRYMT